MLDVMIIVMHGRVLTTGILVMIWRFYPVITFAGMKMARCLGCRYMYDNICIGFNGDYNMHFIYSGETRFVNNILSKQNFYIVMYMRYQGSVLSPIRHLLHLKLLIHVVRWKLRMSMYSCQILGFIWFRSQFLIFMYLGCPMSLFKKFHGCHHALVNHYWKFLQKNEHRYVLFLSYSQSASFHIHGLLTGV